MPGGLKNDNRKHFAVCSADSKTREQSYLQSADQEPEDRDFEEQRPSNCSFRTKNAPAIHLRRFAVKNRILKQQLKDVSLLEPVINSL